MRKILVWSAVFIMIVAVVLTSERSWATGQAQKLVEEGAGQMQQKHYDQAIAIFQKALQEEPQSATTYNLLGMAYRFKYNEVRNKDLKNQEIAAFKKAIEIDPTYWIALINLGATYYYMGEKAQAAPLFKKALTINPNHPDKVQLEKMIQEGEKKP